LKHSFFKIFFLFLPFVVFSQQKNYELKSVEFFGNSAISSAQLSIAIYSKESPNWMSKIVYKITSIGGPATYFDSLLVASDINAILTLYHSKGYFKVKVKADYTINDESETAKLAFTINERDPAIIKTLKVTGLELAPADSKDFLIESIVEDTNQIYEESNINSKNNFTLTFLRDNGYLFASAEMPTVIVDTMKNRVDIQFQFHLGKRYRIGEVFVTRSGIGKESVEDELMKDVVDIKSGNIYSNYDLRRGQVRLLRTNLFSSVYINPIVTDTAENLVPLNISGDVGSMNEISPEIKSSNEEDVFTLGAGLNYIRKNFLGSARKFTIGGSIYYDIKDTRASIEQPFLFGQPITTKLESYYTIQNKKDNYNAVLSGAKLNLEFELPQGVYFNSLNTYLNIERSEYTFQESYLIDLAKTFYTNKGKPAEIIDSLATNFVRDSMKTNVSASTNVILGASFGANKTNDLLFPTSGYSLSFLLEDQNSLASLVSSITGMNFKQPLSVKFVITSTLYPDIYSSKTDALGFKFKIGEILTYRGDKAEIPINQRLYSGGNNSVRGWGSRELVPKNQLLNLNNSTQEDLEAILVNGVSGGFFLFEGSVETRSKISNKVGTALFLDYGNTWNDIREFRFDQIAVAAGIGFRYYTDFIPFRIDFGLKVYDPWDTRSILKKKFWGELFQFQIGIGEAF
jgi:outer membrane protein assembly factor BamA